MFGVRIARAKTALLRQIARAKPSPPAQLRSPASCHMVDMDLALMFHHFRAWAWWLLPFAVILYVALDYLGFEKQRRQRVKAAKEAFGITVKEEAEEYDIWRESLLRYLASSPTACCQVKM